ncbi:hypothetical protein [Streptomyces sp. NPDC006551]|uniref:hypothetical protein n=1 Tax=Streptomyces sp. NPDC006551 TaxID=3157178 RepID=UPI00339F4A21
MTDPTPADSCRPIEVDGETVLVRGSGDWTDEDQRHLAEIVRAAKRRYETEHPAEPARRHTVDTAQLLNLADRAERGPLTDAEAARLRNGIAKLHTRIDEYRDSRRRWMDAAYADRRCALEQQQRAEQAEAKVERVRALHRNDAGLCAECTGSHGEPSPCATIRALDEQQERQPGEPARARCRCGHARDLHNDTDCAGCTGEGRILAPHAFIAGP